MFTLLTICLGAIYMQVHVTLPLDMTAKGLTPADYGLVTAVNGIVIVLISLPVNQYLTRFSRFFVIAMAAVFMAVGLGFNALAYNAPVYALAVVIWTIGELIANPVSTTIIADVSPVERRGLYQGIFGAAWGVAGIVGPIAGGAIYSRWGSTALWEVCLVAGLLVAVGYVTVIRRMYERLIGRQIAAAHEPQFEAEGTI